MKKKNGSLPAKTNIVSDNISSEDAIWFATIKKKSRKAQTKALVRAIKEGNAWRVDALLSLPKQNGRFRKTGIDFQEHKAVLFNLAVRHNHLEIIKIIGRYNNNDYSDLIDQDWDGSIINSLYYDANKTDPSVIEFLIKNGANTFKRELTAIEYLASSSNERGVQIFLENVDLAIEPIKKLLPKAKNSKIYDMLENRLVALQAKRERKLQATEQNTKQITHNSNDEWFPIGEFQIMHVAKSDAPDKTTIKHIFNFRTQHMTRHINDNNACNISESFKFATIPEAKEFIEQAHKELKKHNSNLPPINQKAIIKRHIN